MYKILVGCGGSGGHIYPALSFTQKLSEKTPCEFLFLGSLHRIDEKIFEKNKLKYELLPDFAVRHRISFGYIKVAINLIRGILKTAFIIIKFRPHVFVGFGGFVSAAGAITSFVFCVPVILHEQNLIPGRANVLSKFFAKKICISFPETSKYFGKKAVFTGNAIRNFEKIPKKDALVYFGFDEKKTTILVVGGSSGARSMNQYVIEMLKCLDKNILDQIQILHLTGEQEEERVRNEYSQLNVTRRIYGFFDKMGVAYGATDIAISRAGASTIIELLREGIASILLPYTVDPLAHQVANAKYISSNGAAYSIIPNENAVSELRNKFSELVLDKENRKKVSMNAKSLNWANGANNISEVILPILKNVKKY